MGNNQSKKNRQLTNVRIELEKTLEDTLKERNEYKEKYEDYKRKYDDIKCQLEKSLRTAKTLQRQLKLSEDNASSLYLRYAIESDLNKQLKKSQKPFPDTSKYDALLWKVTPGTSYDIRKRLEEFENRIFNIECILKDTSDYDTDNLDL